jgi:hypothetical protein
VAYRLAILVPSSGSFTRLFDYRALASNIKLLILKHFRNVRGVKVLGVLWTQLFIPFNEFLRREWLRWILLLNLSDHLHWVLLLKEILLLKNLVLRLRLSNRGWIVLNALD